MKKLISTAVVLVFVVMAIGCAHYGSKGIEPQGTRHKEIRKINLADIQDELVAIKARVYQIPVPGEKTGRLPYPCYTTGKRVKVYEQPIVVKEVPIVKKYPKPAPAPEPTYVPTPQVGTPKRVTWVFKGSIKGNNVQVIMNPDLFLRKPGKGEQVYFTGDHEWGWVGQKYPMTLTGEGYEASIPLAAFRDLSYVRANAVINQTSGGGRLDPERDWAMFTPPDDPTWVRQGETGKYSVVFRIMGGRIVPDGDPPTDP